MYLHFPLITKLPLILTGKVKIAYFSLFPQSQKKQTLLYHVVTVGRFVASPCVSSSRGTELKFAEDHCLSDIDSRPFDSYRICHTKRAAPGAVRLGGNSEEEAPALVGPLLHGRAQLQPSSAAAPPPVQSHHVALTAHPRGCKDGLAVATRK